MGWPTRDVVLREKAIADAESRIERARQVVAIERKFSRDLPATVQFINCEFLRMNIPNRLAGVEINEEGDAI